jgi:RNA polymerase sigma factor (sigma-70 family)
MASGYSKVTLIPSKDLQRLIAGCLAKNRSCQKGIYDLYAASIMTLCLRYTRSREEAEEVLQDGFVLMYRSIGQFKNKGSFEGWLRRIIINCALQKYRSKYYGFQMVSLSENLNHASLRTSMSDRLDEKELLRLVQALPPACRIVFNLYVFEGFKHREIAGMLGISEGTSKSNLFDARAILKKHLKEVVKIAR